MLPCRHHAFQRTDCPLPPFFSVFSPALGLACLLRFEKISFPSTSNGRCSSSFFLDLHQTIQSFDLAIFSDRCSCSDSDKLSHTTTIGPSFSPQNFRSPPPADWKKGGADIIASPSASCSVSIRQNITIACRAWCALPSHRPMGPRFVQSHLYGFLRRGRTNFQEQVPRSVWEKEERKKKVWRNLTLFTAWICCVSIVLYVRALSRPLSVIKYAGLWSAPKVVGLLKKSALLEVCHGHNLTIYVWTETQDIWCFAYVEGSVRNKSQQGLASSKWSR